MVVFTRETNRVDANIDGGFKRISLDPNLQVSGIINENVIYLSLGPLEGLKKEYVLSFEIADITGRPNDNPVDVADWLRINFFFGNNYGSGGGTFPLDYANSGNQATMISGLTDIEVAVLATTAKMKGSDVTTPFDSKQLVRYVGGGLDGKLSYITFLTGGRFGTEVARRTLYYDGNSKLEYTEVT